MAKSRLLPLFIALSLVVGALSLSATAVAAKPSAAAPTPAGLTLPINLPGTIGGVAGAFNGTLTLTKFVLKDGQVLAKGVLNGVVSQAGQTVGTITNMKVNLPVAPLAPAACNILNLVLGPLHLNLLGLVVDLNQVVLNITAQPGPGNLLGNLLCGVAGLLDGGLGGGLTGILQNLLHAINGLLKL